ncbi:MAG: hypothetical protein ABOK23_09160 [Candidatus Methanoperedens sp.]|nr:hypothetical protein [Candidatus Methanoperedens sp.]
MSLNHCKIAARTAEDIGKILTRERLLRASGKSTGIQKSGRMLERKD